MTEAGDPHTILLTGMLTSGNSSPTCFSDFKARPTAVHIDKHPALILLSAANQAMAPVSAK